MINEIAVDIQRLAVEEFWFWFVVSAVVSVVSLYLYFKFLSRYRIMQGTATSLIRSAAQGYNEFKGVAQMLPGEPIIAPLTRQACVWYSYKVEELRGRDDWSLCESGISDSLFALKDTTGKVIINPDDADVTHSVSDSWSGGTRVPISGPKGLTASIFTMGKRYRYSEKRIHAGDSLYVLGDLKSFRETVLPTSNEMLSDLLSEWKRNPAALLKRFDENNDGTINVEEWEKAVLAAKSELQHRPLKEKGLQIDDVIKSPSKSAKPFLISTKSEPALLKNYKYKSFGALSLFFFIGVFAVWMFNVRFL